MNRRPEQKLFEEIALVMGMAEAFVEKDWFVTQVISCLSKIHQEGFGLVFTGGTALSKAHHLLQRFSEDVDFRVIAPKEHLNRKDLSAFKRAVVGALRKNGFTVEDDKVMARDENRFFSISLGYSSYFTRDSALRPHIQIEITARDTLLSPVYRPVSSFVNDLTKKGPEVPRISCIEPVESAADKLSAITWRIPDRIRGGKYDDPSIVRHLHDLAILKKRALARSDFAVLVTNSMNKDDNRPKTHSFFSGSSVAEKFNFMLNALTKDAEYAKEYDRFVKGASYAAEGETPSFATAVQAVQALVEAVLQAERTAMESPHEEGQVS